MSGTHILVIDDDKDIQESVTDVLEDSGYKVMTASNGLEGLEYLRSATELPCLIFLDLMMPVMDGKGFREAQLQDSRLKDIPTVLFSANGQIDKTSLQLNQDSFIKKPINLEQLLSIAEKFC